MRCALWNSSSSPRRFVFNFLGLVNFVSSACRWAKTTHHQEDNEVELSPSRPSSAS